MSSKAQLEFHPTQRYILSNFSGGGAVQRLFFGEEAKMKKKWKRVTFFSGYSKDKNFLSTLLKKNSVVQESIAYYLKITTLYKFFKQSGCSRRCLIKCTLVFYCTNQSVHLYCCIILSTSTETSHDIHGDTTDFRIQHS